MEKAIQSTKFMTSRRSTIEAVALYVQLRFGLVNPDGHWNGQCWRAIPENIRSCCEKVRVPSKQQPWPEMRHCRSVQHVYHLFDLSCSLDEFRQVCRKAGQLYLLQAAVSEYGPTLRRLTRTAATAACLELAPHFAVESVLMVK